MSEYKKKYLKYKKKYIELQKKGGMHNSKTSLEILDELVEEDKLKKFNLSFDSAIYEKLKNFFKNIKENQEYLYFPEVFNDVNYFGKRIITMEDLKKMWYSLEQTPKNEEVVKLLEKDLFRIRVKDGSEKKFDGKIVLKGKPRSLLKIQINGKEEEIDFPANTCGDEILNDYINVANIYVKYMMNNADQGQISNFATGSDKMYLRIGANYEELEKRLDNMYDGSEHDNKTRFIHNDYEIYISYKKYNILVKINKKDRYLYIIPVKKVHDKYEIMTYNYKNVFVNEYYYESVKRLFEVLVEKLNEVIVDGRKYSNLPDGFFHIHVVDILNENKIMMVLHAKYEIEDRTGSSTKYDFMDTDGTHYQSTRLGGLDKLKKEETNKIKKIHSFYFLFDLDTNNHNLFSVVSDDDITDYNCESIWASSIALKDDAFGANILDINYILNRPIIITIKATEAIKCGVFCPGPLTNGCDKYIFDDKQKRCAEIRINDTADDASIFIADILFC